MGATRSWNFRRGGVHWHNVRPMGSAGRYRGEYLEREFRVVIGGGNLILEYPVGTIMHTESYRTLKEASSRTPHMVREKLK